jgi:hypothetical protein
MLTAVLVRGSELREGRKTDHGGASGLEHYDTDAPARYFGCHYGREEVVMLGARDAIATVAVKNLEEARVYYEEKLGLEVARELPEGITYRTGRTILLVYASRFAGTNLATCVTWTIDDVEKAAQQLRARGVTFEHYAFPERLWGTTYMWRGTGRRCGSRTPMATF